MPAPAAARLKITPLAGARGGLDAQKCWRGCPVTPPFAYDLDDPPNADSVPFGPPLLMRAAGDDNKKQVDTHCLVWRPDQLHVDTPCCFSTHSLVSWLKFEPGCVHRGYIVRLQHSATRAYPCFSLARLRDWPRAVISCRPYLWSVDISGSSRRDAARDGRPREPAGRRLLESRRAVARLALVGRIYRGNIQRRDEIQSSEFCQDID